jgi:predicted nucleic acid-binding protein
MATQKIRAFLDTNVLLDDIFENSARASLQCLDSDQALALLA